MKDLKHPLQAYTSFVAAELLLFVALVVIEWCIASILFKTYLTSIFYVLGAVGATISADEVLEKSTSERHLDIQCGMRGVICAVTWPSRLITGKMSRRDALSAIGLFAGFLVCFRL